MAKFNVTISRRPTQDETTRRIKTRLDELKVQFAGQIRGLYEKRNNDTLRFSFSAMGHHVSDALIVKVKSSEVKISSNLPFTVALFKTGIASTIKKQAKILLSADT